MDANDLPIADPCNADWEAMRSEGSRRFCAHCSRHVHDLSAMREAEARALLGASSKLCVRYTVGGDGRIRFQPEPAPPLVTLRRGRPTEVAGAGALGRAGVAAALLAACTPHDPEGREAQGASVVEAEREVVGEPTVIPYAPPPPTPPAIPAAPTIDEPVRVKMGDVAGPSAPPSPPPRKLMGKPALPRGYAPPPPPKAPEPCDGPAPGDEVFMGDAPAMPSE